MSRSLSLASVALLLTVALAPPPSLAVAAPSSASGAHFDFSTYLTGSSYDASADVVVDAAGNVYVTGRTASTNFPTLMPIDATLDGSADAFVAKFAPDGSTLLYATYLGGSNHDEGLGIAVDAAGAAYVVGATWSNDFPTVNAFDSTLGTAGTSLDAFVAKISPDGSTLVYASYLGGSGYDEVAGVAVGADGSAYVTGNTASADFPVTTGAFQTAFGGGSESTLGDLYVARIAPSGASLAYATYLGGSGDEAGGGIVVDGAGRATVCGMTWLAGGGSASYPTHAAIDATLGGQMDGVVTRLDASGASLVFSTYFGGSSFDWAEGLALDASGAVVVVGSTSSNDLPLVVPIQAARAGGVDAFVAKLGASGAAITYSTYLGGEYTEEARDVACDAAGVAHVALAAESTDLPLVGALQTAPTLFVEENPNAYVARVAANGSAIAFSTYLGDTGYESADGIAADTSGATVVVGGTDSFGFPMFAPYQSLPAKDYDDLDVASSAFVTKISAATSGSADLSINHTVSPDPGTSVGTLTFTYAVHNFGPDPATHVTITAGSARGGTFWDVRPGFASATASQGTVIGAPQVGDPGAVVADVGTIAPNGTAMLTVVYAIEDRDEWDEFRLYSFAQVHAGTPDANAINNTRNIETAVFPAPPLAPDLTATAVSVARIDLVAGHHSNIVSYTYERRVAGGEFAVIAETNASQYSDRGLTGGTTYEYRVRTHNAGGASEWSSVAEATTEPGSCEYQIHADTVYIPSEGGTFHISVSSQDGCPIPASSGAQWLTLEPRNLYSTSVGVQVAAGPPPQGRVGVVLVAGTPVTVVQRSIASGPDSAGVYLPASGAWFLKNSNAPGDADAVFTFGPAGAGWTPLSGDWNGDGVDTPGLFAPATSTFFLKDSNAPGPADHVVSFGPAGSGWKPIVGDWDGDGEDEIGLYDQATGAFFLRYELAPGPADVVFTFGPGGNAGWVPLAGNFHFASGDEIALYAPDTGTFFVKYGLFGGPADVVFSFGPGGTNWIPLVGDWNHDTYETVGLYVPASGAIFMRNALENGPADWLFTYGPPNAVPVTGNWDGL